MSFEKWVQENQIYNSKLVAWAMLFPFILLPAGLDYLSDTSSFWVSKVTGAKRAKLLMNRSCSPELSQKFRVAFAILTQSHCLGNSWKQNGMADLDCYLDRIRNHLGDKPFLVYVMISPSSTDWENQTCSVSGQQMPKGSWDREFYRKITAAFIARCAQHCSILRWMEGTAGLSWTTAHG